MSSGITRSRAPYVVKSHRTNRVACGLAKFGLIPAWAKDDKTVRHTYNARSETAAEKPSYRTAWRHRQYGLVLVDNLRSTEGNPSIHAEKDQMFCDADWWSSL